jgi:hypothetical protein
MSELTEKLLSMQALIQQAPEEQEPSRHQELLERIERLEKQIYQTGDPQS